MKNLENYGVQSLDAKEIREIEGGFWGYVIGAAVSFVVLGIHDSIDYPEAFLKGLSGN